MTTMRKVQCKCVANADKALQERHTHVETTLFTGMVAVRTALNVDAPKRTRPVTLIASYCPFCGKKYPAADTVASRATKAAHL